MPAPDWRSDLDDVLGSVDRLNDSLKTADRRDAEITAQQLRTANGKIWRMVNELEASHQEFLWNVGGMIADIEAANSEDDLEVASIFVQLANDGVLKVMPKALIKVAKRYGIDPDDYLNRPHVQGDKP